MSSRLSQCGFKLEWGLCRVTAPKGARCRQRPIKERVAQAIVNFADDEELLALAAKAGRHGAFIGFESLAPEGLAMEARRSTEERR